MVIPRILGFPDDESIWRLEGFADFGRNWKVPGDPRFFIILRREDRGGKLENVWEKVDCTAAMVPFLHFASQWQGQRRIADHSAWKRYELELDIGPHMR